MPAATDASSPDSASKSSSSAKKYTPKRRTCRSRRTFSPSLPTPSSPASWLESALNGRAVSTPSSSPGIRHGRTRPSGWLRSHSTDCGACRSFSRLACGMSCPIAAGLLTSLPLSIGRARYLPGSKDYKTLISAECTCIHSNPYTAATSRGVETRRTCGVAHHLQCSLSLSKLTVPVIHLCSRSNPG